MRWFRPYWRRQWQKVNIKHDQPLIITFVNNQYRRIALNWVVALKRLHIQHFVIIALDKEIYQLFKREDIQVILMPFTIRIFLMVASNLGLLWLTRMFIFSSLLNERIDFIHSDVDAVWLRNPIPRYFTENSNLDISFSQGTVCPRECYERWKFVACMGLFYMKSTPATRSYIKTIIMRAVRSRLLDDQTLFNACLLHKGVVWDIKDTLFIPFGGEKMRCSKSVMVGNSTDITVGILPFEKFPRLLKYQNEPYVVHPLTEKDAQTKERFFKNKQLWFLQD